MADLTFRTIQQSTSGSPFAFGSIPVGAPHPDRKLLIAFGVFGINAATTVRVNGVVAHQVNAHPRPTNRQGLALISVPDDEFVDIEVTVGGAGAVAVGVWTAIGALSVVTAFNSWLISSGYASKTIATADGGFVIGTMMRSHFAPGWSIDQQFVNGGFSGAHATPTDGNNLTVSVNSIVNINSGWTLTSFAVNGGNGGGGGGGDIPDDGDTPAPGAMDVPTLINAVFFRLDTDPPLRLWCGINDIPIEMVNIDSDGSVYLGAGRLLNVPDLEVLINGLADRVEFYLPGVSVANSNRIAAGAPDIQGAAVHVGVAALDDRYQPITPITPVWYGNADLWAMKQPPTSDPSQPTTRTLVLSVGSGRTGRARPRRAAYTDAQQKLLYPTDRFCDRVARYTQLYDVEWPVFAWPLWLIGGALALSNWMGQGLV